MHRIPLVDLRAQHEEISHEVIEGLARVMDDCTFILGPEVARFEAEFAAFSGVRHCVGVANGTDALELSLRALQIGRGDEVILPANTFIATALAVERAGARPVLVDVDPRYLLIDPAEVESRCGPRTRAVIPVHLFGQMAPMEPLVELCRRKAIHMVEDAAQAQGAIHNGLGAGAWGALAGTSFYPGKNLGSYGDAGAVLTASDQLAARVRALRNYGSDAKYSHPVIGFNSRLDTMQAVVLSAKLRRLARWNGLRRSAAAAYDELLRRVPGVQPPETAPGNEHVFHIYAVRVQQRDDVLSGLLEAGIGAAVHYPLPIHLQGAFSHLGHELGSFPEAERGAREVLSLPLFPHITLAEQEQVVDALRRTLRR